jgi:hypothetical protein
MPPSGPPHKFRRRVEGKRAPFGPLVKECCRKGPPKIYRNCILNFIAAPRLSTPIRHNPSIVADFHMVEYPSMDPSQ